MSLSDAFKFEQFALSDLWEGIKKNPERLLIGAIGPWSTKAWNKVLGKDYEPLLDQMGGPYGGHTISAFGNTDGGVYQRARDAGVGTASAEGMHDAAHAIGALYGGQGIIGGLGNIGGAASSGGLQMAPLSEIGGGNAGVAAAQGVIPGGAGMGSAAAGGGALGTYDWIKLSQQGLGMMQPQQNLGAQANAQVGQPNMRQPMGQRINEGLGRAFNGLTPVDPRVAATMDPAYLQQMRNQAILQMGLGMMGSASAGGGFGEALATGYGLGQSGLRKNIEDVYERGVVERAQQRADDRMAQEDARYQQGLGQRQEEFDYRRQQDEQEAKRWQQQFNADQAWRRSQSNAGAKVPAGYRLSSDGNLEFIPGGPADPAFGQKPSKPTEYERKARLLYAEMTDAEDQYNKVAGGGDTSIWNSFLDSSPVTRVFTDEAFRQREAAGLRWAQNFLYLKSGAAATNEEVRKTFVQYMPQPGDTQAVIDQKAQARQQAMDNVAEANALEKKAAPANEPTIDEIRAKYGR